MTLVQEDMNEHTESTGLNDCGLNADGKYAHNDLI